MTYQRFSLIVLPLTVIAILYWGYPLLDALAPHHEEESIRSLYPLGMTGLLSSVPLFFWLLALASKLPVHKLWKPVLAIYLVLILPISPLTHALTMLWLANVEMPYVRAGVFFTWLFLPLVFFICGYRVFRSRFFAPFMPRDTLWWPFILLAVAGLVAGFIGWLYFSYLYLSAY